MKTICVYHDQDYDGLLSAAVVLHFIPDAELIGHDYGRPCPAISPDVEQILLVDLSIPDLMDDPRLIWIDHHKSAIEKWDNAVSHFTGEIIPGIRIDGVAACRLCWKWFIEQEHLLEFPHEGPDIDWSQMPDGEPLLLRLAGIYDVWEDQNPQWQDAVRLQYGLDYLSRDPAYLQKHFLDGIDKWQDRHSGKVLSAIQDGEVIERYVNRQNESICRNNSYVRYWEGLTFLVLNSARGNSRSFPKVEKAWNETENGGFIKWDDIDALCMWKFTGEKVTVSLYHHPDHKDLDLSRIAVKYGGGGHRGACGFQMSLEDFAKVLA